MIDREKVIADLRRFINYPEPLSGTVKDALELLKSYEYARCTNCQFRDFGENEVDSWDRCKLHRHNTSPEEYCSWFVERVVKMDD